jgi:hypothetical protein
MAHRPGRLVKAPAAAGGAVQYGLQSAPISSHDLPQNRVVEAVVFMANTVSDCPDLRPWLSRVVSEPLVGNRRTASDIV